MTCYHPIHAWREAGAFNPLTGKWPITFQPQNGSIPIEIPCGKCIGCRLEYSRQWAIRCVHEALMHEQNTFLTLTYNDEHCPDGLQLDDFQRFMKRLRKFVSPRKIRFFHCGEYGEQLHRPHYHVLIFGYDFPDKIYYKSHRGNHLYVSPSLDRLWSDKNGKPLGYAVIGDVTFESCAYCARYITKKWTGKDSDLKYLSKSGTGEILRKEYCTMSRRPGIGTTFLETFADDVYNMDRVLVRGHLSRPPRFYDRWLENIDSERYAHILDDRLKQKRKMLKAHKADNTPERLAVREEVKLRALAFLRRCFDESGDVSA